MFFLIEAERSGAFPAAADLLERHAAHHQSHFFNCRLGRLDDAHDLAFVHDRNAIGELQNLFQLGGYEQNADAVIALIHDVLVDILDRADVQATRRMHCDQQFRLSADFTRDDHLLLIAAGKVLRKLKAAGRFDAEIFDELIAIRINIFPVDEAAFSEVLRIIIDPAEYATHRGS